MTAVRRLLITLLSLLVATAIFAQEPPVSRTTQPVTAETDQDVNNERAMRLSLDEAIRTAMERNLGIQLQEFQYQQSGYSLRSAYGIYDFLGRALLQERSSRAPVTSTIEASSSLTQSLDLSVSQNMPAGGAYTVSLNNSRQVIPPTAGGVSTFSPKYRTDLGLAFNQPLMRDFGLDIKRRNITFARNTLGISHETFRLALMDTAFAVEQAYFDLVYARRNVDVIKQSLFLARDQARITQIRIDVGASAPLDILQPRVTIATSEEQLILGVARVRSAEDRLRALLHLEPTEWDRPIIPTDPVDYRPVAINVADSVARAMDLRPELRQNALTSDTRRVQYLYARNQTLPQLDFDLNYGLGGVAGNTALRDPVTGQPTGVFERIPYGRGLRNIFEGDFPSWVIGVNLGVPITNIGARAEAKRSELAYKQSLLAREQTRETITVDVRAAARNVDTAARSIVATRAAREAAEKNVEAERRRYENGMTTNFQVLQVQQQLSDARVRELQALVSYIQFVAAYHRAVGDILEVRNITVDSPELPEEPRFFSQLDKYNWLNYGSRVKLEEDQRK